MSCLRAQEDPLDESDALVEKDAYDG